MPSGLTSDIYEGKDVSLRDYLMQVGRGMGFAIMQRDDPYDEPVKEVEEQSYYSKQLRRYSEEVAELEAMSDEDLVEDERKRREDAIESRRAGIEKSLTLRARYEDMRKQVVGWDCPAIMESTREYALKQLDESIRFDCGEKGNEDRFYHVPKVNTDPDSIRAERIAHINSMIERCAESKKAEDERNSERSKYIRAFLDSLPPE